MENKAHALAAGLFVLVAAALLGLLALWLGTESGKPHRYEISTRESVSGLQPQAPVRFRGVDVGKVVSIGFDPQTNGNILLQLDIDEKTPLTQATFATLDFQGVTGLAFVQLDDTGQPNAATAPVLRHNDAKPPRLPLKQGLLTKLAARGESLLEKSEQIAIKLNAVLDTANQQRFSAALDNISQTADSVKLTAQSTEKLVTRLDTTIVSRLNPALAAVPPLAADASKAMRGLQTTSEQVGQTAGDVSTTMKRFSDPQGTLDDMRTATQSVTAAADGFNLQTIPRMNRALDATTKAAVQTGRTVGSLSDNPQGLIFGNGPMQPGPGEPGFTPPGSRP